MEDNDRILCMEHIEKTFPGVKALDDMNMTIAKGKIMGLVGENGAGKSTLIKVLSGAVRPDRGFITIDGQRYSSMTPSLSIAKGISVIYQEVNLVGSLTVYENIFLGKEIRKNGFLDEKKMVADAQTILDSLDMKINVYDKVKDLSVGFQQLIEIAKAIAEDAKVLVLDEPTSALSNSEVASLFAILKKLKTKGVSMIYISHRLEEIFEICDDVTIMRDGHWIGCYPVQDVDRAKLINLMVGRKLEERFPERDTPIGEDDALRVEGLCGGKVNNVSFSIKHGEILGLAGLVGAGRTETVRVLFGADPLTSGTIYIDGKETVIKTPIDAIEAGIGLVPEDRKLSGLNLMGTIVDNVCIASLRQLHQGPLLSSKKERDLTKRYVEYLSIKTPTINKKTVELSGGNQQKVVLAKWLATRCRVLILDEPTRGIDVLSKQEIYKLMRELTGNGIAVLMISSEMPELLGMADRIVVMHDFRIVDELPKKDFSQTRILDSASGGNN